MSEIFVYDKNPCKRPEKDIYDYVSRLAPRAPYTYVNVGKGLILKFQNEEDTNFIFTPSAILSFETHNLNVSLTIHSQRARNIYISNPPDEFLKYSENQYIMDIWTRHGVAIPSFKIFKSRSNRYYFIITPVNSTVTLNILNRGKITLLNYEFTVEPMRGSKYSNKSIVGNTANQNKAYNNTQGLTLPVHSNWGNPQSTQVQPIVQNGGAQHQPNPGLNGSTTQTNQQPAVTPKYGPPPHHPTTSQYGLSYYPPPGLSGPPPLTNGSATQHNSGPPAPHTGSQIGAPFPGSQPAHEPYQGQHSGLKQGNGSYPGQQVPATAHGLHQGQQSPSTTYEPHHSEHLINLYSYNLMNLTKKTQFRNGKPRYFCNAPQPNTKGQWYTSHKYFSSCY